MAFRLWQKRLRWARAGTTAAIAFVLAVSPWFLRNYRAFDTLIPFRDNVGLELYVGNQGQTWHFAPGGFHPSDTPNEWAEFQQFGELKYMQHKRAQAMDVIRADPWSFLTLSLRRALYMWTNFWSLSSRYLKAEPAEPFNIFLCTTLTSLAFAGLWRAWRVDRPWPRPSPSRCSAFRLYYLTHPELLQAAY
jgi:hypothetical protein